MTDAQLIARIAEVALLRGQFKLRSGRTSNYYLDKYLFETQPDILSEIADRMARHINVLRVDRLAGAELGGIPLVTAAALATGKPMVLIRNQKKDYGTSKLMEGKLKAGERIFVCEDIATTGGQVLEAAKTIEEQGALVVKIVAVIDRQEGARENIERAGFKFDALFTKTDLGITD